MENIVTYHYVFKMKDGEKDTLGIKILSDTASGHEALEKAIREDDSIISCIREYVGEVDCSRLGSYETVKVDPNNVKIEEEK